MHEEPLEEFPRAIRARGSMGAGPRFAAVPASAAPAPAPVVAPAAPAAPAPAPAQEAIQAEPVCYPSTVEKERREGAL